MPLALELAAARAQSMPVDDIAAHLDDRLRLLTAQSGSALPRHQTLRALLDWSYELLSPPEKRLFRRLSIFAGGWTLKTALPVCDAEDEGGWALLDRLCGLVDKSLVEVDRTGDDGERGDGTRYRFLETVRAA